MHPQYHTVIGRIQTKGWGIHPYCHQASRLIHAIRRDLPILSENPEFSRTEHLLDLRPVCKFKFVICGPVENSDQQAGIWFGSVALSPIITFPHFTMV